MAQSNWQRSMKNVSLTEEKKDGRGRPDRRTWQFEVNIDRADQTKLKNVMAHELHYYNILLETMASRASAFPESLLEISDRLEKIFSVVAETQFMDMGKASMKSDYPLPADLESLRGFITGRNDAGVRNITDRTIILFEAIADDASLYPLVRKNMAVEFLDFFKTQAKLHLQVVPAHLQDEQTFKVAPESLEPLDSIRKRHIQLSKNCVKVVWDEKNERSKFYIPYLSRPLIVETINFTEEKNWNYIIIHQVPGSIPLLDTPWTIDIRNVKQLYILKYIDVRSPHASAAYNLGKRGGKA